MTTSITRKSNGFTCDNFVALFLEQSLVEAIQCHITFAVVEEHNQAITSQILGKHDRARINRFDLLAVIGINDQTFPINLPSLAFTEVM
ncbi:Uncharacterised protein [Vibrio cholerae]|nr:Uncharacterised protein [Vibrio cholerae]CSI03303.1 Uncharacterised protein [Vibrio cholerae]CSI50688.1 Uncharacterised protein [Vibrio cholerae]